MKLIVLLNLLLLIVLVWAWNYQSQSATQLESAQRKLQECRQHALAIETQRSSNLGQGLAEKGHDCFPDIVSLLQGQGLKHSRSVRVSPPQGDGEQFAIHKVDNPIRDDARLDQILGFLLNASSSPVRYYTSSISLQPSASKPVIGPVSYTHLTLPTKA